MTKRGTSGKFVAVTAALALSVSAFHSASASVSRHGVSRHGANPHLGSHGHFRSAGARYAGGGLQCVPFARGASGIEIGGNAWTWWDQASGVYERGAKPEAGSVLTFRANGRMQLGHVAVVSDVVNAREIEIDHANWSGRGGVNHAMRVVDVSERNDWTAVRVEMGRNGDYGSIYPTYGFIYDRPDHGTMLAAGAISPAPDLNPAPADLRGRAERLDTADYEEVAEVPEHRRHAGVRHHHARRFASR